MNFVDDVKLHAAKVMCPDCNYTKWPQRACWGTQFVRCKACELKRQVRRGAGIREEPKPEDIDARVRYYMNR